MLTAAGTCSLAGVVIHSAPSNQPVTPTRAHGSHLAGDHATRALHPSLLLTRGNPASITSRRPPRNGGGRPPTMCSPALVPDGLPGDRVPQDLRCVLLVLRGPHGSLLSGSWPQSCSAALHPILREQHKLF